jgi:hypothetical protein
MSTVGLIVRELLGLFVDDGSLAVAISIVVVLAVISVGLDAPSLVTGAVLFLGCLIALVENISRATTRK